jgi:hypothetical protein
VSPRFGRGTSVPAEVLDRADLHGERVLAHAEATDGTWLIGTRDALFVVEPAENRRIAWEQVQSADWVRDEDRLRVVEVAPYGERQRVHTHDIDEPDRLLQLVRERVTASVVLSRRVRLPGRCALTVIARRPPRGTGALADTVTWAFDLEPGVDPADPEVREAAETALRSARQELGLGAGSDEPPI